MCLPKSSFAAPRSALKYFALVYKNKRKNTSFQEQCNEEPREMVTLILIRPQSASQNTGDSLSKKHFLTFTKRVKNEPSGSIQSLQLFKYWIFHKLN